MMKGLSGKFIKVLLSMVLACSTLLVSVFSFPQSTFAATTNLYASPTGSGSTCSIESPCSLSDAQTKVRTLNTSMTGDIIVYLRNGTYTLSSTFRLTQEDSGTGGFNVIYQAYPGETPVLSGGQTITSWSVFDSGKNIYRSYVGTSLNTRQLYVNGVRATRARGVQNPSGFTKTSTGFTAPDTSMSSWGNQSDIELISFNSWKAFRCPVSSISGTDIAMQNHCWNNSQLSGTPGINAIAWFENAYELLDSEGEWYLDRTAGYLYYKPLAGENMASADIVVPTLQTLLSGTGTLDAPIQNVQIKGVTFAYATWLQPSTSDGYVPLQAGFTYTGFHASATQDLTKTPGNVTFHAAKSVRLERNTFTHLGGSGLVFEFGSQNNTIIGNIFRDISASAIQIGDVKPSAVNPTDIRERNTHNTIQNNYITNAGAEYFDGVGILGGYTSYSTITHNEVTNLPYSGISQGWGWGTNSYAQNNQITNNYIHDLMNTLGDGGGIYTLSAQPDSTISGNYLQNMYGSYGGWGIYPDEGSAYFNINNNVVKQTGRWISMWTGTIHDNVVQSNYSDTENMANACTYCTVTNNMTINNGIWPAEAQNIISHAGLEQAYWNLSPLTNLLDSTWPNLDQDGNTSKEWTASTRGFVRMSDSIVSNSNATVIASVYKNDAVVWGPQTISQGEDKSYQLYLKVLKGDKIRFVVHAAGSSDLNPITWNPNVKFENVPAACDFTQFNVPNQVKSKINTGTKEILITVKDGTDITNLTPDVEISEDCHSVPNSAEARDFSQMVTYEVKNTEGTFSKVWKVFVTKEAPVSFIRGNNINHEIADFDNWYVDGASVKDREEGSITISNGSSMYKGRTFQDELLEFDMKSGSAGGVEWPAISIRQKLTDKAVWDPANEGYILVFKPDEIELQRFNSGVRTVFYGNVDGIVGSEGTLPNHVFEMDKKHLVQFGAKNTAEGVRLVVYIDARKIIDYVDNGNGKITSAGYMGVYAYSAPVTLGAVPVIYNLNHEIADFDNWYVDGASVKDREEGSITISNGSSMYKGRTFQDELLEFDMKSGSAGGVEWPAISIRQKLTDKALWDPANEGYILVFKPEEIELQRYNGGVRTVFYGNIDGIVGSEGTLPNNVFEMDKKHLVQFGAKNTAEGVRLVVYIDGRRVIDFVDNGDGKITSAGYMGIYAYSAPVTIGSVLEESEEPVDPAPRPGENLALNQPATAYLADGSSASMYAGFEAAKAVDGNAATFALVDGQHLWQLQVDLGSRQIINRVVVKMPETLYATEFDIKTSTDGVTFTTVKQVTGFNSGTSDNTITETKARYVRIVVVKPDGPYQIGLEMAISELEVYNPIPVIPDPTPRPGENLALNQPAAAYFANGSSASMYAGFEAAKAVDGNAATFALANGQHLWQLQVDLGSRQTIGRIVVKMPETLYATEFDIKTSTDGIAFTTVKQVTGFASGTSDNAITETTARYVRIVVVKPDGPYQTGLEMAISELEVYNPIPPVPAAPSVTLNDVTNRVTGLTTAMEYKLDSAAYVMYNATIFNALDLSGSHTLLVRIPADKNTGAPAGLVTTLIFTATPGAPAAPSVTLNDVTNSVTGLTTAMEYKLDSAAYVMYNATIFNALDLSGSHTLLVRIPADENTGAPAGLVTTLIFTPAATPTSAPTSAPTQTPGPALTPTKTKMPIPTPDPGIAVAVKKELDQTLNDLTNKKPLGEDSQTTLRKATKAVKEAIEKQSEIKLGNSVNVEGDIAILDIEANQLTDIFAAIKDNAAELNAKLAQLQPNAEPAKVTVTLNLGEVVSNNAEIRISADLVQKAKDAGFAAIAVKVNGVTLTTDVSQFNGSTTLHMSKQAPTAATDITNLKVASDVYNFEFSNTTNSKVTFTKPVIVKLPIASIEGVDTDLLVLAKVMDGKLQFYGGKYNPETKNFEAERNAFSTYVVVENKVSFNDIASVQAWAGKAIGIAAAKGIIEGRGNSNYAPNERVTRAEFITMIVKTFHLEDDTAASTFSDVNADDWFKASVAAAAKAGIIYGRTSDRFAPNETISRAEMAAITARALIIVKGYKNTTDSRLTLKQFDDANAIDDSLAAGVALALNQGIVIGFNNSFNPNSSSTRAEAAVVISRLLTK